MQPGSDGSALVLDVQAAADLAVDSAFVQEPSKYPPEILPVIYLDVMGKTPDTLGSLVNGKAPPSARARIRIIEDHNGTHKDLAGKVPVVDLQIDIGIHGSSSAAFPQKSFGMNFPPPAKGAKTDILGMPSGTDWDLIACWTDKPCMRDPLAYAIGRLMGRWAPRSRFVEVYFNNAYQGLYQFTEAPKQDSNRVDIPKPAPTAAGGDITGGYIVRREAVGKDRPGSDVDWLSPTKSPDQYNHQTVFTYGYPNHLNITAEQKAYIKGHMAKFEEAMKAAQWNDVTSGYRSWIDVPSWIDFALVNELSNNVDGYWKSMYITKLPDDQGGTRGKLMMTPLWDFNIAFGNANYRDGWRLDNKLYKMNRLGGGCSDFLPKAPPVCDVGCCTSTCNAPLKCWNVPYISFWWDRLWSDTAFLHDLKCRWQALRKNTLTDAFLDKTLTAWKAQIKPNAAARHFAKWTDLRTAVWPNPCEFDATKKVFNTNTMYKLPGLPDPNCGAYTLGVPAFVDFEVQWMRDWTSKRMAWLDSNLPGTCN